MKYHTSLLTALIGHPLVPSNLAIMVDLSVRDCSWFADSKIQWKSSPLTPSFRLARTTIALSGPKSAHIDLLGYI